MQQCADPDILTGNCSAVCDAVLIQYTCTGGSVSVNVQQQVLNTRVYVDVRRMCFSRVSIVFVLTAIHNEEVNGGELL